MNYPNSMILSHHNVVSSILVGRVTDPKRSQDPTHLIEEETNDESFWQILEKSINEDLQDFEQFEQPKSRIN